MPRAARPNRKQLAHERSRERRVRDPRTVARASRTRNGAIRATSRLLSPSAPLAARSEPLRLSALQISEFPAGDFGSNRQAVSVETDRPFRSKSAPRCGWVLVPTLANRRCVIHPILLWSAKASTLVIIIISSDCCGRLWIVLIV